MTDVEVTVVAGCADAERFVTQLASGVDDTLDRIGVISEARSPRCSYPTSGGPQWLTIPALEGTRHPDCTSSASRLDLVLAVRMLIERPRPCRRVFVLVAPGRSVATVAHTIIAEPDLRRLVELDSICTVVDTVALSTRLSSELPFGSRNELEALAIADRIVAARADQVTGPAWQRVARSLRTVNRLGLLTAPSIRAVDVGEFVGLGAWSGPPRIARHPADEALRVVDGDDLPTTITLECDAPLDPEACEAWFDELLTCDGVRLLRLQGEVAVDGEDHRIWCRGIYDFACSEASTRHDGDRHRSQIVVVGHGLCAHTVREHFEASIVR